MIPEDRYVDVGSIRTRWWSFGDPASPTVLLLHGLGGFMEHWLEIVEPTAEHFHVVALDMAGFGKSDKPNPPFTNDQFVKFIEEFMAVLGLPRSHVVGHSLGGLLGVTLAADFPSRVASLSLIGSAGFHKDVPYLFKPMLIPGFGRLLMRPTRMSVRSLLKTLFHDRALITPDQIERHYDMFSQFGVGLQVHSLVHFNVNFGGIRPEILTKACGDATRVQVPALIIWGRQDKVNKVEGAHKAAAELPDSQTYILDACGHMPQLEHPERVTEVLLGFLQARESARKEPDACDAH